MDRIITVSRQFGSGGHSIGKRVAKALGIPFYDQEVIEKVSEKSGFSKEYIAEQGEYITRGGWFGATSFGGMSVQDQLWIAQRNVILELAKEGPCVIVGRCADDILKDKYDILSVFIHADMENRKKRIVEVYGESDVAPEKRLKEKDKRRAAYYRYYTESEWGDSKNYDLCLNSSTIGMDGCAELIVQVYRHMEQ